MQDFNNNQPAMQNRILVVLLFLMIGLMLPMFLQSRRGGDKSEPAGKKAAAEKKDTRADAEKPAAVEAAGADAEGAGADTAGVPVDKNNLKTAAQIIAAAIGRYKDVRAYEVKFYLQQPLAPKDANNAEKMERLREIYHLAYKRRAGAATSDFFRLEGVYGGSKCSVVGYSPDNRGFSVFHLGKKPQTLRRDDPRLADMFHIGFHAIALDLKDMIADRDNSVSVSRDSIRKTPEAGKTTDYYTIHIKVQDKTRIDAYINRATFDIEILETFAYNKRGRTESTRYTLTRRQTWFDFNDAPAHTAGAYYTEAPVFKNHPCMR